MILREESSNRPSHDDKEATICLWKVVMDESYQSNGTSYNVHELTVSQKQCLECSGQEVSCPFFIKLTSNYNSCWRERNRDRLALPR